MKLEKEAMSDVGMLPDTPAALAREWRSFDRDSSALGALASLGWVVLAAIVSTLAVLFIMLFLEKLTERGWHDSDPAIARPAGGIDRLAARTIRHILRAVALLIAVLTFAWIWIDAIELTAAEAARAMPSAAAAAGTLLVAYIAWELARLAIDRHLQDVGGGPKRPGAADAMTTTQALPPPSRVA
jgi:hypothetical protein